MCNVYENIGYRDIETRDTSGKEHSMKMAMEAMPGDKIAQSVVCYRIDIDICGAGREEGISKDWEEVT